MNIEQGLLEEFIKQLGIIAEEDVSISDHIWIMNNKLQSDKMTLQSVRLFYLSNAKKELMDMHNKNAWTFEETRLLVWIIVKYQKAKQKAIEEFVKLPTYNYNQNIADWEEISKLLGFKEALTCQFQWLFSVKKHNQNRPWSQQEDNLLFQIISDHNFRQKWQELSHEMFMKSNGEFFRKGKQYRERWNNYLNPQMKRGFWTEDEDLQMLEMALEEGLKWSILAKRIGNRTENAVKNRINSLINKQKKIVDFVILIQLQMLIKTSRMPETNECNKTAEDEMRYLIEELIKRIKQSKTTNPLQFQSKNTLISYSADLDSYHQQQFIPVVQYPYVFNAQQLQQQQLFQMQFPFCFYPLPVLPSPFLQVMPEPFNNNVDNYRQAINNQGQITNQGQTASQGQIFNQGQIANPGLIANPGQTANPVQILNQGQTTPQIPKPYCYLQEADDKKSVSQFSSQDQVKEEEVESSSSSSQNPKEPIVLKQLCLSQAPSLQSSKNNSTGSQQSLDGLQVKLNHLSLNINQQSDSDKNSNFQGSPLEIIKNPKEIRRVLGGSQRNIIKEQNKNARKLSTHLQAKRSRFYYQSQDQE